jgi:hypothetical protein
LQVENAQFCSEKFQGILPAKFSLQRNTFHRLLEAETLASGLVSYFKILILKFKD